MTAPDATVPDQTSEARTNQTSPYEFIGGAAAVRRLVDRFYEIVDTDPAASTIRAMHERDLAPIRELLFEFLSGWLGGPALYFDRPEHRCIRSAHRVYEIGPAERDEWMMCMRRAMADCEIPEEMRALMDRAFLRMADGFRTR